MLSLLQVVWTSTIECEKRLHVKKIIADIQIIINAEFYNQANEEIVRCLLLQNLKCSNSFSFLLSFFIYFVVTILMGRVFESVP